jgi:hypothetical protein
MKKKLLILDCEQLAGYNKKDKTVIVSEDLINEFVSYHGSYNETEFKYWLLETGKANFKKQKP